MTLKRASFSLARFDSKALIKGQLQRQLATVTSANDSSSTSTASSINSSSTSSWKPPIETGVEAAYDEAIKYISEQSAHLKQQLISIKSEVEKAPLHSNERVLAEAKLHATSIASQINDPEIRWRFKNDPKVPLSNPVFAHLREKTWREKALPRLMERVRLMRVVPDAFAFIAPTADVQVAFGEGSGIHDHGGRAGNVTVGCFVGANESMIEPSVTVTPFHAEERLYTLALVDLDAPDPKNDRLSTYALWLAHNIPLSLTKTNVHLTSEQVALSYIPPHPQNGTKYHRYALLLLEQNQSESINYSREINREGFSIRNLIDRHSLRPSGLHFWRAQWSQESRKSISKVYKEILQENEPVFLQRNFV